MRRAGLALVTLVTLAMALTGVARADESPPANAESPKRSLPDYDGRGPAPPSAGEQALWVPRVILSPVYFTTEYLVRRPLGFAVTAAERADVPRKLYGFFTFGPEHKAGFAPIGFVDFGFNPSVGVYVFWNDAGFAGDDLHLHVETWPTDWLGASLTQRIALDPDRAVQFRVEALRRPDYVFYGLGPAAPQSSESRFGEDRLDGGARLEWRLSRDARLDAGVGIRAVSLYDGHYDGDPGVAEEAAAGAYALPPGLGREYTAVYDGLRLALDTRPPRATTGSGLRLELVAEQGSDLADAPAHGWIRYGATGGAFWDVDGRGRILSLSVTTLFADPLGSGAIPFTELVRLGGSGPMRGYYEGRLVDRSAAVATARYAWPIAPWLDGTLQAAFGNVFGTHLDDLRPGLFRFSGVAGISTAGLQDYPVELLVGMGSETFESGGRIDAFRASLSVNHGF